MAQNPERFELDSKFEVVSSYIARWALPYEGIPLFLLWKGKLHFDTIKIEMPDNFAIRDYYNTKKEHANPREVLVDELKTDGYFGFVFTSPSIESLSQDVKVTLNFLKGAEIVHKQEFETTIVRPRIDLQVPDKIELSPVGEMKVDIKLRFSGYGFAYGKIMVSDNKDKLVLDVKDLRDLFLVMSNANMFKQFIKKTQISEEEFVGAKIPQDQYDYKQLLLSSVQLSDFSPTSFFESIRRMADDKTMAELLERAIEKPEDVSTEFFKSIIDFVEKRPVEGVFLVDPNIESIELGMGQRKLYVCIGYVDNFGNYYHEIKEIPMVLKEKATINFRQDWEEQAGDWNWLLKKK